MHMTEYETDRLKRYLAEVAADTTRDPFDPVKAVALEAAAGRVRFNASDSLLVRSGLAMARLEMRQVEAGAQRDRAKRGRPSASRGRRSVSLRTASSGPGPKRRLRMQVRATPGQGAGTGQAVVSTLNLAYDIGYGYTEMVLPGAFAASIAAHPTIPIFYNHSWDTGPVGVGKPSEQGNKLIVDFELFLGKGDLVDRVYQAMSDEALTEWSVGFWAEEITVDQANPKCDMIAKGDLAEASVCVRGANPETGTLELAGRSGWLMGDEHERRREVEIVKRSVKQLVGAR
jgi:HK97 family phage prohead protease